MPASGYDSGKNMDRSGFSERIQKNTSCCKARETIMASLFECEVRFVIADIDAFRRHLEKQGGKILFPYEFTDHYFKPVGAKWRLSERNLRIREWNYPSEPTTIFFVKTEIVTIGRLQFKRALYPEGKVPLYSGNIDACRSVLEGLGFEPWFEVAKKYSALWDLPRHGFKTPLEFIEGLGWTGELEFEGEDPQQAKENIENALKVMDVPVEAVTFKPISEIFAETTGKL
jgi:adenylate cyclase class IV